jgi:hypothetical protein
MLIVIKPNDIMLSVVNLNAVMVIVVKPNAIMLSVVK